MNVLHVEPNEQAYSATARAREILETLRHQRKQFEEKRVVVLASSSSQYDTQPPQDDPVKEVVVTPHKLREASQQRRDRFDKHLQKEASSRAPSETTPVTEASTSHPGESSIEGSSIILESTTRDHVYPIPVGLREQQHHRATNDVFRKEKPWRVLQTQAPVRHSVSFEGPISAGKHRGSLRQTKSHEEEHIQEDRPSKRWPSPSVKKGAYYRKQEETRTSSPTDHVSRSMSFDNASKRSTGQHRIRETKSFGNEPQKRVPKEKRTSTRRREPKRNPGSRRVSKAAHTKIHRSHSCDGAFRRRRYKKRAVPREGLPLAPSLDSAFPREVYHHQDSSSRAKQLTLHDVEIPLELSPIHRWEGPPRTESSQSKRSVSPRGVVVETGEARSPYLQTKYENPRQELVDTMKILEKRRSFGQRSSLAEMALQTSCIVAAACKPDSEEVSGPPATPEHQIKDISGLSLSNENDRHQLLRLLQSDLAEPKSRRAPIRLECPESPQSASSSEEEQIISDDSSSCELTTTTEQLYNPMMLVGIPEGDDCDVSCLTMPPLPLIKEPGYKVDKEDKQAEESLLFPPLPPALEECRISSEGPSPQLQKEKHTGDKLVEPTTASAPKPGDSRSQETEKRRHKRRSSHGERKRRILEEPEHKDRPSRESPRKTKSQHRIRGRSTNTSSSRDTKPHRSVPAQGGLYHLACQSGLTPDKLASRSSFTVTTRNLSQLPSHALRGDVVPVARSNRTCGAYNSIDLAKSCGNRRGRKHHLIPFFDTALYAIAEDESGV